MNKYPVKPATVSASFWRSLDHRQKVAVANHEADHASKWNAAADQVVNDLLAGVGNRPEDGTSLGAQFHHLVQRPTGFASLLDDAFKVTSPHLDMAPLSDPTLYVIEFTDNDGDWLHTMIATVEEWYSRFGSRPGQQYVANVVGYKDPAEVAGLTDLQRGLILEVYDPFEALRPVKPESVTPTMWDKLEPEEQLFLRSLVHENTRLKAGIAAAVDATVATLNALNIK